MTAQIPYQHSSGYISHFHNNELDAGRGRDYNVTIKYLDDKEENIEGQAAKISHNASLHIPVLLCLVISLGGFIFGWDIGTIGGMTNMVSFQENFGTTNLIHDDETIFVSTKKLTDLQIGLIISIFNISCGVGALTLSKIGDWIGRKGGIWFALVVYCIGITIQILSYGRWYFLTLGRAVTGIGVGVTTVLVPMFLSENSPLKIRGSMVSTYQLIVTFGILMGNILNFICERCYKDPTQNIAWQLPLFLGYIWAIIIGMSLVYVPESPQYLAKIKNDVPSAKYSFARMNGIPATDSMVIEFIDDLLENNYNNEETNNESKKQSLVKRNTFEFIMGKPKLWLRLIIGMMIMTFQQLSGINYFFYYGTSVFKGVGIKDPYITSIILSSVNFLSTILGIYYVEKWGRKTCLLYGSTNLLFYMMTYATVGTFGRETDFSNIVLIIVTCCFIFWFAITLGPVTFVLVSELFPLRTRAISMAICTFINWMLNFLISLLTPMIVSKIDFKLGYIFAACLLALIVFSWILVPETRKKNEQEINKIFEPE
ncbi:CKB_collapsed_G0043940.mRNA.1.CDS.1 [Saccharomyces cerevisiae]|nr:HXT14p Protein like hexose transporter family members [Saccharomyces boulardii (nom. inval.)]CAI5308410.1 CKB_HP2_G0041000.mRNA.1.CDS.1 [Saccharomyces cerevisiae]KQC41630.1 HXT14p [Saccharomyces boulardii (nom. inval.)]CAI6671006.1 CKB_HP2_G0041000.mRNA.1.CDS.1 [Saccharomyces cerevisiae]CAI6706451.1 CKB_HP1_G0042100.mRNA.1.CDS.1 [Saccharomyces cerevisiae]